MTAARVQAGRQTDIPAGKQTDRHADILTYFTRMRDHTRWTHVVTASESSARKLSGMRGVR